MRLIDADELIKHFKNQEVEGMNLAIDLYAIDCINNAPTVIHLCEVCKNMHNTWDSETCDGCTGRECNFNPIDPVRHGEWVATDDPWFSACSVCGYLEYDCLVNNYCPECGAKMERPCDKCQEWDCYGCDYKQAEREDER